MAAQIIFSASHRASVASRGAGGNGCLPRMALITPPPDFLLADVGNVSRGQWQIAPGVSLFQQRLQRHSYAIGFQRLSQSIAPNHKITLSS